FVLAVRGDRKAVRPKRAAIDGVQANQMALTGLLIAAGDEQALAPEHGRRMAFAGQFRFPDAVVVGPGDGGGTDAGAVGHAEAGPILALGWPRDEAQEADTARGADE